MAYEDMFADALETVKLATRAADARDDEDDVISLSSKASADPRSHSSGSEEWQQVFPDPHFQRQYWTRQAQNGWQVPLLCSLHLNLHIFKIDDPEP
jgi:hypothetical protein